MDSLVYILMWLANSPETLMVIGTLLVLIIVRLAVFEIDMWLAKSDAIENTANYKYVNKLQDVTSLCDPCDKDPNRYPGTGMTVHKRLYPTGTTLAKGIPNLECLKCGHKKEAKYEGKAI